MSVYSGQRQSNGTTSVSVNGRPLDTNSNARKDSATAFDWGYEGRGAPALLALAILADHYGDEGRARRFQAHFLRSVIRQLPSEGWTLTGRDIDAALPGVG
jgi:Family of unknown function (DUF6166)